MDSNTKKAEVVGQATAHDDPANAPSVLDDAQALWSELRGLGYDHLHLAALETQRAGESLVSMVMAAVMVAILLMGAWLGLMAGRCCGRSKIALWRRVAPYCWPWFLICYLPLFSVA